MKVTRRVLAQPANASNKQISETIRI